MMSDYINWPREEVGWFSMEMERKLEYNDARTGWRNLDYAYLARRFHQEVKELQILMKRKNITAQEIIGECADIANFVMMIADNAEVFADERRFMDTKENIAKAQEVHNV